MLDLHTPDQFRTKPALLIMGAIGLVLAYVLLARALDTASWWEYFGTLLLVLLSVRLIRRAFRIKNGKK